jgi:putative transposase
MFLSCTCPRVGTKSFSLLQRAFLQANDLPFCDVLTEEEIGAAFVAEDACFGEDEDDIYTPALTLWGWLSQAMHAEKARSCVAAVTRITALCVALGRKPPSPDTGAYCRARAKLPERVLQRLVYTVGDGLESRVPVDWLWLGRHVKMGDGTTLLTPDTDANQEAWPQQLAQKPGLGFPILRMAVLISLATAALCGLAIGPYKGKETGETALLRELLNRFQSDDVFLGDCAYASYFMLALLLAQGVDVVTRQHQARRTDFRQGQQLGVTDHVVVWGRPQRPAWMDGETYSTIPETLTVRELKVRVDVPGFRV